MERCIYFEAKKSNLQQLLSDSNVTAIRANAEISPKKEGVEMGENFMDGNARMMKYLDDRDRGPVVITTETNYRVTNGVYGIILSLCL